MFMLVDELSMGLAKSVPIVPHSLSVTCLYENLKLVAPCLESFFMYNQYFHSFHFSRTNCVRCTILFIYMLVFVSYWPTFHNTHFNFADAFFTLYLHEDIKFHSLLHDCAACSQNGGCKTVLPTPHSLKR